MKVSANNIVAFFIFLPIGLRMLLVLTQKAGTSGTTSNLLIPYTTDSYVSVPTVLHLKHRVKHYFSIGANIRIAIPLIRELFRFPPRETLS